MRLSTRVRNLIIGTSIAVIVLQFQPCFSADALCADLFTPESVTVIETSHRSTITALREVETKILEAEISFRHPLSAPSIDYIRIGTGLSELTPDQATELYNNNLRLLTSRAKAKAEDLVLEDVLRGVSMSQLMSEIFAGLRSLSQKTGTEMGTTPAKLRMTLKRAIHNTGVENFSKDEIVAIVELQALYELKKTTLDRNQIEKIKEDIQARIRPQIAYRLQVDREPGCCRSSICNTCPNSFRLKEEVFRQTGKSLNTHLKRQPDLAVPSELKLFELQSYLKKLVPDTNW